MQAQQANYEVLLTILEDVYSFMTEGTKLSAVYNKCLEMVKDKKPSWVASFPKNIGFGEMFSVSGLTWISLKPVSSIDNVSTIKD